MSRRLAGSPPAGGASFARERVLLSSRDLVARAAAVTGAGGELWLASTGWSMRPALPDGAGALLSPVSVPRVGDIVLTRDRPVMLHRVLRVSRDSVQTAGDSCAAPDLPIPLSDVVAVVTAIDIGEGPSGRGVRSPVGSRAKLRFTLRRIAAALFRATMSPS